MKLYLDLLKTWREFGISTEGSSSVPADFEISEITTDSRGIKKNSIFFAIPGNQFDGHDWIESALKSGAKIAFGQKSGADLKLPASSLDGYHSVKDVRRAYAIACAWFHDFPSRGLQIFAVTGTSGKTTTAFLLHSILRQRDALAGLIGTIDVRYGDQILKTDHTTPDAWQLQSTLAKMLRAGTRAVAIEVSSHAIDQRRVDGVFFDGMIFTGLSHEHLDYHHSMDEYFVAKSRLFFSLFNESVKNGKSPRIAVHTDSEWGGKLALKLDEIGRGYASFGLSEHVDYSGHRLLISASGIHGSVRGLSVDSNLVGSFNAENILGAISVLASSGFSTSQISAGLSALQAVPGRLERVPDLKGARVILVDYAHKPDALQRVLKTLRDVFTDHRIVTVFGCGGDRDPAKRPQMGKIACQGSDQVIVTSDNPRREDPAAIIREIVGGTSGYSNVRVEPDRAKAIRLALTEAKPGDCVLIAGKGHETYQIIADLGDPRGTRKIAWDDREYVRSVVEGS